LLSDKKIHNALIPEESGWELLQRIQHLEPRKWHISFQQEIGHAYIWPYLIAAGGGDNDHPSVDRSKTHSGKSQIQISIKEMHQCGNHFNKHGRGMGFTSKKEYDRAAREFAETHQVNPKAKMVEGILNSRTEDKTPQHQRAITYGGRTVIICTETGQIKDFYRAGENSALKKQKTVREGDSNALQQSAKQFTDYLTQKAAQEVFRQSKLGPGPGSGGFRQLLNQNRLNDSYNSANPGNPILKYTQGAKDIGGVACVPDYIQGLFDSDESLLENEHIFFMPQLGKNKIPFSNEELRQLIRELAIGIYVHDTVPFFSLHFNTSGQLYPVIHPVYANTLVGKVISWLDYIMKGYLNGGVFSEKFVEEWNKDNKKEGLEDLIDFKEYCQRTLLDEDKKYTSLQELLYPSNNDKKDPSIIKNLGEYSNSFRILAVQKTVQKNDGIFAIDWDFKVEYTIECSSSCQNTLDAYSNLHNASHPLHTRMVDCFDAMKKAVHDHMIKLPLCQKYFSMLGLISFLSNYFYTLKKHGKEPILEPAPYKSKEKCPSMFPNLPVGDYRTEKIKLEFKSILHSIISNHEKKLQQYLEGTLQASDENGLREFLTKICIDLIKKQSQVMPRSRDLESTISKGIVEGILQKLKVDMKEKNISARKFIQLIPETYIDQLLEYPLTTYVVCLPNEVESNEFGIRKTLVGGCGVILKSQKIEPINYESNLFEQSWKDLQQVPNEFWVGINNRSGCQMGTAFKMGFKDSPIDHFSSYLWMESTLDNLNNSESFYNIHRAMVSGNFETFKRNKDKFDLHSKDRYGRSLLHLAAREGNPQYVEYLLSIGLNAEKPDKLGFLPIHYAAMEGNVKTLEQIYNKNSRVVDAKSNSGISPLMSAIQYCHVRAVDFLLQAGASLNSTSLSNFTPLHCALSVGDETVIFCLLNHGNEISKCINTCTEDGVSPLMLGCYLDSPKIITALLDLGADPLHEAKNGTNALSITAQRGCVENFKLLFRKSKLNRETIASAFQSGNIEVIKLLSNHHSFHSYRDSSKNTPLMIAIKQADIKAAFYILSMIGNSRDLTDTNDLGESALEIALMGRFFDLADEILKKEINHKLAIQIEPILLLKKLCRLGYSDFLRNFINRQKDLSKTDYQELAQIAFENGHHVIITLLLAPHQIDFNDIRVPDGWKIEHFLAKIDAIFLLKKISIHTNLLETGKTPDDKSLAYIAAEHGSWNVLRFILGMMIKNRVKLDNQHRQRHLLYGVLMFGDCEGVKLFFDICKDLRLANTSIDELGSYPVHIAAKIGSASILQSLFNHSASLDSLDSQGKNALFYAVQSGSRAAIKYLSIQNKSLITSDVICEAAQSEDPKLLTILIENGADLNIKCPKSGDMALLIAARNRQRNAFVRLVNEGAFLNIPNKEQLTPLILLVLTDQPELLRLIANKIPYSQDGINPLDIACRNNFHECATILMQSGYTSNELDLLNPIQKNTLKKIFNALATKNWRAIISLSKDIPCNTYFSMHMQKLEIRGTLLHHALRVLSDPKEILKVYKVISSAKGFMPELQDSFNNTYTTLLIAKQVNVTLLNNFKMEIKNNEGHSLLHIAAALVESSYLIQLLEKVDPNLIDAEDNEGRTPLFFAIEQKKENNVAYLIKAGANVNHKSKKLISPLIAAIYSGQLQIVKKLIESGAYINQKGTHLHLTPIMLSLIQKTTEISMHLMLCGAALNSIDSKGNHLAHVAAMTGQVNFLKVLALKGFSLEVPNKKGVHPIHMAAQSGQVQVLKLYQEMQSNLDISVTKDSKGFQTGDTALLISARFGHVETTQWCLAVGADPDKFNAHKLGLLPYAALSRNINIYHLLEPYKLFDNLEQNFKAITCAIQVDDPVFLNALYSRIPIDAEIQNGMTGLALACVLGSVNSVKFLLSKNANPTFHILSECNPLEIAAGNSNFELFKLLINYCKSNQIDFKIYNEKRQSLVHRAAKAGNLKHLIFLISSHFSLNEQDYLGFTPLHYAAQAGHREVCLLLICCGASLTTPTLLNQKNPLELIEESNQGLLKGLIEYGLMKKNANQNESSLQLAVRLGNRHAVLALINEESIHLKDHFGNTALHEAVRKEDFAMIRLLVRNKAFINSLDSRGHSPLWIACFEKRSPILIRLLKNLGSDTSGITNELMVSNLPEKKILLEELE
jgi:ankyrin repeat protein